VRLSAPRAPSQVHVGLQSVMIINQMAVPGSAGRNHGNNPMQSSLWVKAGRALAMAAALLPAAAHATLFTGTALFNFENIAAGTPLPFTETINGLSATFTGNASICNSGGLFVTLSGNVAIQQFCGPNTETGPLGISFSEDLSSVSFNFATVGGANSLTVEALENGAPVSTSTFNSSIPPGQFADEGFVALSGIFNMLVLTGGGGALLAIDNVSTPAVSEPGSIALLGAALAGFGILRRRRTAA
jgi:hypothetical protein